MTGRDGRGLWEDVAPGSGILRFTSWSARKACYVVVALGNNVHIFARPHRRTELARCFETVLGSPVRTVELPGIDQPMLIVSFPGGGSVAYPGTMTLPGLRQPAHKLRRGR